MEAAMIKPFMQVAVSDVLESMCFVSTEAEVPYNEEVDLSEWVCGELEFVGSPTGKFGLALPPSTAAGIAANFLGEDEMDVGSEQISEVVGELTNMVCGSLLAYLDSQQAFTLSAPREVTPGSNSNTAAERVHSVYGLDEGSIYIWLELQASV